MSASAETVAIDVEQYMSDLGVRARIAAREIAIASTAAKNQALLAIADAIESGADALKSENQRDLNAGRQNNLAAPLLDRLELTDARIQSMADGLRQIAQLPDPVGAISEMNYRPSGLQVGRMRVPLGVIGIIYESRPNVTADAAALCLKSGNATVLRGGSEAIHSNRAIAACIASGLRKAGLSEHVVQVVETTDRAAVGAMITMPEAIDIIIPRGGKGLIERIARDATVPVIKHLDGICHVFIDDAADATRAIEIAVNSKTYRYGICGAMETLLIAESRAPALLPELVTRFAEHAVELRGCERARSIASSIGTANVEDWQTEYLAPILSIRVVEGIEQAMEHIAEHGSAHTDSIVTENLEHAQRFMREVDSSSVMVNAATCFADGFEYGLGAEIGISTDKLHVRGPVGLEGLTTQKFVVVGQGTVRS